MQTQGEKRKPEGDSIGEEDLASQVAKRLKREVKLATLTQVVKAAGPGGDPSVGSISTGIPSMGGGNFETPHTSLPVGNSSMSTNWPGANLPQNLYSGPGDADRFTDEGEDGELTNVHSPVTMQALSPKQMMDADPKFYGAPGLAAMDSKDRENFWLREKDFIIGDKQLSKGTISGATHANGLVSFAVWNLCMRHYCSRVAAGEIKDEFPRVVDILERFEIKGYVLNTLEHLTSVENHANQTVGVIVGGHSPQVPNYWMASPHGRNCPGIALAWALMKCDLSVPWELVRCTPDRHSEGLCVGMGDYLPRRVAPEDLKVIEKYELTNDEEMNPIGVRLKPSAPDANRPKQLLAWQLVPVCVRDSRYMTDDLATTPYGEGAIFRVGMRGSEDAPTGSLKAVSLEMIMSILAPVDAASMMFSLKRAASILNKTTVHIGHGYSVNFQAQMHDEKEIARIEGDGINKIVAVLKRLGFSFQHKNKKPPAAEAVSRAVRDLASGQGLSTSASNAAGAAASLASAAAGDAKAPAVSAAVVPVQGPGGGINVAISSAQPAPTSAAAPVHTVSVAGVPIRMQGAGSAHTVGTGKSGRKKKRGGKKGRKALTGADSPTPMSDADVAPDAPSEPDNASEADAMSYEMVQ